MYGLRINLSGEKTKCNEAIYTFVAVDNMGKPSKVAEVNPETDPWKRNDLLAHSEEDSLSLIISRKTKSR